jgi:hypothetical protein
MELAWLFLFRSMLWQSWKACVSMGENNHMHFNCRCVDVSGCLLVLERLLHYVQGGASWRWSRTLRKWYSVCLSRCTCKGVFLSLPQSQHKQACKQRDKRGLVQQKGNVRLWECPWQAQTPSPRASCSPGRVRTGRGSLKAGKTGHQS